MALGVPEESTQTLLLVLSELLTNGVIHDGADQIVVRLEVDEASVAFTVVTADGPVAPAGGGLRTDPDESGRGLPIVAAVADDLVIDVVEQRRATSGHVPFPPSPVGPAD